MVAGRYIIFLFLFLFPPFLSAPAAADTATAPVVPAIENSTADLSVMQDRHVIRVLVNYSKTNFFFLKGKPCGYEYELLQQYGKLLNKNIERKEKKLDIVFIPLPFEQLLPALVDGRGDIAAAGFTITPERQESVAFTSPYLSGVDEIVVANKKVKGLKKIQDLSNRNIYVLRGSSYVQHLNGINEELKARGLKAAKVVEADKELESEDILEMVNAGVVNLTVCDRHIGELWARVFPNLILYHDIKINAGGEIAWAVRKDNPELLESLSAFIKQNRKGTLIGNIMFKRYFQNTQWIKNPLEEEERQKLDKTISLFRKYGERYNIDWLAIAAQAYQESGLDNGKKSSHGAIGIMQVLPSTAADSNVNISDVHELENNIHAGVKYLAFLRDRYFTDPAISRADQINFALAAYNAGPRKVRQLRSRTMQMELDPNTWFFNVELVALQMNFQETVRYVANIHKYYIAYKLVSDSGREGAAGTEGSSD